MEGLLFKSKPRCLDNPLFSELNYEAIVVLEKYLGMSHPSENLIERTEIWLQQVLTESKICCRNKTNEAAP